MSTPHEQIRSIFLNAAEVAAESKRSAYLDERCSDNAELRGEVEDLLRHHKLTRTFIESSPVGAAMLVQPITEKPGTQNSPEVRRILRNRSRYEIANNSYAHWIGHAKDEAESIRHNAAYWNCRLLNLL